MSLVAYSFSWWFIKLYVLQLVASRKCDEMVFETVIIVISFPLLCLPLKRNDTFSCVSS